MNLIFKELLQAKNEPLNYFNKNSLIIIGIVVLGLFLYPFISPSKFALHLLMMIFMHAVMSQSWNVLAGFSGQISLGHAIFFGIGAYASGYFYTKFQITPWFGIIIGIAISAFIAFLIGVPMLRLKGHYFAIATLLIGISFQVIFQRWPEVGASAGLYVPINRDSPWLSMQFHKNKVAYYYITLVFFIITFFLVWLLNRSKLGYRLKAIRDQSEAASSLGIHVSKYKVIAFIISAMIMAPMGSIYAQYVLIIDPNNTFSADISILVLLISVMGGVGNIWGPIIGSSILIPISEFSRIYFGGTGRSIDLIIYGILIILICIFRPSGIVSLIPRSFREREKVK